MAIGTTGQQFNVKFVRSLEFRLAKDFVHVDPNPVVSEKVLGFFMVSAIRYIMLPTPPTAGTLYIDQGELIGPITRVVYDVEKNEFSAVAHTDFNCEEYTTHHQITDMIKSRVPSDKWKIEISSKHKILESIWDKYEFVTKTIVTR